MPQQNAVNEKQTENMLKKRIRTVTPLVPFGVSPPAPASRKAGLCPHGGSYRKRFPFPVLIRVLYPLCYSRLIPVSNTAARSNSVSCFLLQDSVVGQMIPNGIRTISSIATRPQTEARKTVLFRGSMSGTKLLARKKGIYVVINTGRTPQNL